MADRYWVGGTGSWSSTNTANWSTSSGGAGGASVPTAADNVIFDANSNVGTGAFTVTMANTPRVCNDFTASGLDGTMTLAGTSIGLTVSGSLSFPATNFTRSYSGVTTFNATTTGKTITTNGVAFGAAVTFDGVGGGWTLGSAISSNNILTVTNGTFDTSSSGNYAVTVNSISSSNSNVRTINLNGSTVTLAIGTAIVFTTSTNLTLNAGTSTINLSGAIATFAGGGQTFYNVSFTSAGLTSPSITGANTFNNLTITGRTSIGIGVLDFSADQTINGTFTVSAGTASAYRIFVRSVTIGTTRTLTCAAVSLTDVDFRDITIAGAASPASGTRLGDCKGNSGITFPAAKTVYYRQTGSANWGATGSGSWSATSGGALNSTQFPLAQDTAVFPAATYPASGSTTTINSPYNIGTIDMSLRTSNTMTLATSTNNLVIIGNWINGTGITLSGTGALFFAGRTTQQITSAGRSFTQSIFINSPSGTFQLQDALTMGSSRTATLTNGTLDLQSYTLSTGLFNSTNSNTRTIAFGTGNITCTGTGSVWDTVTVTGLTTTGTQVVNVTSTGSTAIRVDTGTTLSEANSISYNFTGGTYALTIAFSTSAYRNLNFTGFAGSIVAPTSQITVYGNLTFSTGMTLWTQFFSNIVTFAATSGTQQITTNAKTLDFSLTFNGVGGTVQLQDALTMGSTRTATLTNGTLDLQSYTLSTGLFNSSNSNTRTIAFGTGNITCTGTGTVWQMLTATSCTVAGTPVANITSVGSTSITVTPGVLSEANSISFNFTGGTYTLTFLESASFHTARNVDFTGYAGTWALATGNPVIYGNLKISTGMTIGTGSGEIAFSATSGTQQITSNGKTFDVAIEFNGVGGTFRLEDALTLGSSRKVDLINGTLDLNGKTLTLGGVGSGYFSIGAGTKNITFNGGTLVIATPSTIAFVNNNPTGFTTTAGTGTGTISMTAATAKTFVGGGSTFNCTLNQGGAGALTISGSNTFSDITNTVQPASILFTAGTTSTFTNFNLSGTAGNLITIGSVTAASHTLSKASGTVSVSFCSISRSNGTGGATWEAFTANGNVDGGNNTGWSFAGFVVYDVFITEAASGIDSIIGRAAFYSAVQEASSGIDAISSAATLISTISEAGSGIDQIDASQEFLSSISETGSGLDQVDANFTVNSNASETASGVDEVFSAATFATDIAESGSGVDETSALQTFTTDIAESASGLDQADAAQTFVTNVAESGSGIDQIDASQDFSSNIFEAGSGVDQVDTNFTVNSDVLETVSGVDSSSSVAVFLTDVNETASGMDSVSSAQTFVTDVSEAGSGIDQIDAAQSFVSSVSEAASGQDEDSVAASTFNAYAEEAASGVDSDSVAASTFNAYSDESASGLDNINAKQVFGSAVVEEAFGVDNISAAQSFATSVSETGSGIDQVDSVQSFASSITETASGIDSDSVADSTFNAYADESASGVDAASSNVSFGSAIDENASGVDAISSAQTFVTNITETAQELDFTSVAASIFNAALSETASGLDVISSNPIFGSSIAESASGVDSIFSSATFVSNIAETASGVDSISAAQGFAVLIDENASGLDAFTVAASIFNAAFTDSASGIDALQPNFTYFITVPEGVSALDQIIGGYLWNPVDDTQNPNWGNVSNTQAAGWAAVDDTQTINWQNVNNTNAPGWASVDGTQSPSWTDVQTH